MCKCVFVAAPLGCVVPGRGAHVHGFAKLEVSEKRQNTPSTHRATRNKCVEHTITRSGALNEYGLEVCAPKALSKGNGFSGVP